MAETSPTSEAEYVVFVTGGFEELAVGLIAQSLGLPAHAVQPCCVPPPSEQWVHKGVCGDGHVFAGEAGVSKIRFKLPQPTTTEGWAAQHTALAQVHHPGQGRQDVLDNDPAKCELHPSGLA